MRATDASCKSLVGTTVQGAGQGHQCLRHEETSELSFVPKYFRFHYLASNFYQLGRKACRSCFLRPLLPSAAPGSPLVIISNPASFPSHPCATPCQGLKMLKSYFTRFEITFKLFRGFFFERKLFWLQFGFGFPVPIYFWWKDASGRYLSSATAEPYLGS